MQYKTATVRGWHAQRYLSKVGIIFRRQNQNDYTSDFDLSRFSYFQNVLMSNFSMKTWHLIVSKIDVLNFCCC